MGQIDTIDVGRLMEEIIKTGANDIGGIFGKLLNCAMAIEREHFLGAAAYERSDGRHAYANGYKDKTIDTLAGTMTVSVPKTRGHEGEAFYPQSLERGRRATRAVLLTMAHMYISGVSTRDVEGVMREFGIENISSSQVSRAVKLLDEELSAWRNRALGVTKYLIVDARYEKVRQNGAVADAAVLSAIGIDEKGTRRVLGVSVAVSEHEVHWRSFLNSLVERGMRGVEFIVSDAHAGLNAARRAVLGGARWQRCQFHLGANAIHQSPNLAIRKAIGVELRSVWNAPTLFKAKERLTEMVVEYRKNHVKFADWLEKNIPEGLNVFDLPEEHRKRMRTSNGIERCVQQELKRRTRKIRVFPNEDSLLRLVTAILVEIDETWATKATPYVDWEVQKAA